MRVGTGRYAQAIEISPVDAVPEQPHPCRISTRLGGSRAELSTLHLRSPFMQELHMSDVEQIPLLDFMLVRPPSQIDAAVTRRRYIRDTVLTKARGRVDADLYSAQSASAIGRLIYKQVFCGQNDDPAEVLLDIRGEVLALLTPRKPPCDAVDVPAGAAHAGASSYEPLNIADLERHAYLRLGDLFFMLPDQLAEVQAPLCRPLAAMLPIISDYAALPAAACSMEKLIKKLGQVFDTQLLSAVVFTADGYTGPFQDTKRALFDALYLLYVLRRWATINLESIMNGLRALHILEALAVDELYALGRAGHLPPDGASKLTLLAGDFPELRNLSGAAPVSGLPQLSSPADLAEYLSARPIVAPIFAQLTHYARPFNAIKPLGVGDLKVVKQRLLAYEAGEISDIHNIMQGEAKERVHRRLEKTEESFSSSSTTTQESTRDTASTDRFELKREAEQIIKTDLSVNANLHAQYNGQMVLVAVGAGFAYNRASTDQQKLAQSFSREVVDKAVTRVQTSVVEQRSTTKTFETEETNKHGFTNVPGAGHLSGIYRWVDKRYRAQVFNYGKRMMFEFVLPEPAAFLVESRLRAFESTLDYPRKPKEPVYAAVSLDFTPSDITAAKFQQLRQRYDLATFTYPVAHKSVELVHQEGSGFFSETAVGGNDQWYAKSFVCKLGSPGYAIEKVRVTGSVFFQDNNNPPGGEADHNIALLRLDGDTAWYMEHNLIFNSLGDDNEVTLGTPHLMQGDDVSVTLAFQDLQSYHLLISASLALSADALLAWQTEVWNAVAATEKKRIDDVNRELKLGYDAELTTFRNRIAELKATAIHDLIQGQSEAYNRDLIMTEVRRQCMAVLTKDFDEVTSDDLLTNWEAMGTRTVNVKYRKLEVDDTVDPIKVEFTSTPHAINYPVPNLDQARDKGRYIQFLEQAFEWGRLGYICYPYFWATPPKWIDLMNRTDDGDPNLTSFLRAGAIKVLVAATPAYTEAVLHFLATREPWEGGPSPVIGDPLYLPLFEELHQQQDDRYGAVPEGEPWTFTLPTSLVYLHGSTTPLPVVPPVTP
jgi:hypothetical protein